MTEGEVAAAPTSATLGTPQEADAKDQPVTTPAVITPPVTNPGASQDSEQAANQLFPGGSGGPLIPLAIGIVGVGLALLMVRERVL